MNPIAKLITVFLVGAAMLSSAAAQALTPTHEQVRKYGREGFRSWIKTGTARSAWRSTWPFMGRSSARRQLLEYRSGDTTGTGMVLSPMRNIGRPWVWKMNFGGWIKTGIAGSARTNFW